MRSSTTTLGVPTLPNSTWYASSGSDAGGVAQQRREPHRGAGLEAAVVVAGCAGRRRTGAASGSSCGASAVEQVVAVDAPRATDASRSRPAPRAAAGPARRWRARPRSRTGGRPSAESTNASVGCTARHRDRRRARRAKRLSPSVGDHDRRGLVGPVDRDLLGDVVGVRARAARPRTRGSAARTRGRCASCPRWRRRRSTCSRAPRA